MVGAGLYAPHSLAIVVLVELVESPIMEYSSTRRTASVKRMVVMFNDL